MRLTTLRAFTLLALCCVNVWHMAIIREGVGAEPVSAKRNTDSDEQWPQFVSADFCSALVIHPSKIARAKGLTGLAMDAWIARQLEAASGSRELAGSLRPENVRRVVILAEPFPGGNVAFFPAAIIQFNADVDAHSILSGVWKDIHSADAGGKSYFYSRTAALAGAPLAAYAVDSRTVLVAPEGTLRKMIDASREGQLAAQCRKAELSHDMVVLHSGAALAERITKVFNVPIERFYEDPKTDEPVKVVVRDIKTIYLAVDLDGTKLMAGEIVAQNREAAERVSREIGVFQGSLKDQLPQLQALINGHAPHAVAKPASESAAQLLDGFLAATNGSVLSIDMPKPLAWPKLIQAITELQQASPEVSSERSR